MQGRPAWGSWVYCRPPSWRSWGTWVYCCPPSWRTWRSRVYCHPQLEDLGLLSPPQLEELGDLGLLSPPPAGGPVGAGSTVAPPAGGAGGPGSTVAPPAGGAGSTVAPPSWRSWGTWVYCRPPHVCCYMLCPGKVLLCSTAGCSVLKCSASSCESCRTKLRSYRGLLTHLHTCSKVPRGKAKVADAAPPLASSSPNPTAGATSQNPPALDSTSQTKAPGSELQKTPPDVPPPAGSGAATDPPDGSSAGPGRSAGLFGPASLR
uniref:Uncharacterized protein n=1 Tax=Takifugu rubripes TaxID=31033 RepID=A0A3B5K6B3_TAKRU